MIELTFLGMGQKNTSVPLNILGSVVKDARWRFGNNIISAIIHRAVIRSGYWLSNAYDSLNANVYILKNNHESLMK